MSEQELEAKMKQILDDYAPILNITPNEKQPKLEKLSKPRKRKKELKKSSTRTDTEDVRIKL